MHGAHGNLRRHHLHSPAPPHSQARPASTHVHAGAAALAVTFSVLYLCAMFWRRTLRPTSPSTEQSPRGRPGGASSTRPPEHTPPAPAPGRGSSRQDACPNDPPQITVMACRKRGRKGSSSAQGTSAGPADAESAASAGGPGRCSDGVGGPIFARDRPPTATSVRTGGGRRVRHFCEGGGGSASQ